MATLKITGDSKKMGDIMDAIISSGYIKVCDNEILVQDEKEKNVYERFESVDLQRKIYEMLPAESRTEFSVPFIKELIERMRRMPELVYQEQREEQKNYVRVKNGIFNVNQGKVTEDEKLIFRYCYNFHYLPNQTLEDTKHFKEFIETSFEGQYMEGKTELLLQILGYCLSGYTEGKVAFFLVGVSNSGKSVVLDLMKEVLGKGNYSTLELSKLSMRFNKIILKDSKVNICDEISGIEFKGLDVFKAVVSGEEITGERKGQDPMSFHVQTKLLSAGNVFPHIRNTQGLDALENRMVVLAFSKAIVKDLQNLNLREDLKKERDVIFSLALDALTRLKENQFQFQMDSESKQLLKNYIRELNSLDQFYEECLEPVHDIQKAKTDNGRMHLVELWEMFTKYCAENLVEPSVRKNELSNFLQSKGFVKKRFRKGKRNAWGFEGIRMKKTWNDGTLEQE